MHSCEMHNAGPILQSYNHVDNDCMHFSHQYEIGSFILDRCNFNGAMHGHGSLTSDLSYWCISLESYNSWKVQHIEILLALLVNTCDIWVQELAHLSDAALESCKRLHFSAFLHVPQVHYLLNFQLRTEDTKACFKEVGEVSNFGRHDTYFSLKVSSPKVFQTEYYKRRDFQAGSPE
jgi:hypothetical protein